MWGSGGVSKRDARKQERSPEGALTRNARTYLLTRARREDHLAAIPCAAAGLPVSPRVVSIASNRNSGLCQVTNFSEYVQSPVSCKNLNLFFTNRRSAQYSSGLIERDKCRQTEEDLVMSRIQPGETGFLGVLNGNRCMIRIFERKRVSLCTVVSTGLMLDFLPNFLPIPDAAPLWYES